MTLKTKIITGLAALVMGLTPACGGDEDVSPYPTECQIKEYVDNQFCEDFTGEYLVLEPTCTSKYDTVFIKTESYDSEAQGCSAFISALDKKSGEEECLELCDFECNGFEGNYISDENPEYTFIKCNDNFVKMKWYNGDCEAWLEKVSPDPGNVVNICYDD